MTIRRWLVGQFFTPIQVEFTVPPADVVPGALTLDDTPAAVELEQSARLAEAVRLVEAVLEEERRRPSGCRNVERFDMALDLRSALRPSAPGSEVLREVPPVGIRHAAQVAPGRAA